MAYIRKRSNGKWSYTVSHGIDPFTQKQIIKWGLLQK